MRHLDKNGFTIVELMISTVVFSVILLILTAGILQIGHVFVKGVLSARTQETARSIMDDVGQSIQFAGGTIIPSNGSMDNGTAAGATIHGICTGSRRYTYVLGKQVKAGNPHMLVSDAIASGCTAGPGGTKGRPAGQLADPLSGGGQELLGTKMRLSKFTVTQAAAGTNVYDITVRVVYGDDDLLCSPSIAGDCNSAGVTAGLNNPDLMCKQIRAGSQFCAVSELSTTVEKRLK